MLFDKVFLEMDDGRVYKDTDESIFRVRHITLHTYLEHASYTIGAGAFWGQFFLVFFLGSGLVTFPQSCFITWADRPKPSDNGGFKK